MYRMADRPLPPAPRTLPTRCCEQLCQPSQLGPACRFQWMAHTRSSLGLVIGAKLGAQ